MQSVHAQLCDKYTKNYQHNTPSRLQHAPHPWVKPTYGQTVQLTEVEDSSPLLDADGVSLIQRII